MKYAVECKKRGKTCLAAFTPERGWIMDRQVSPYISEYRKTAEDGAAIMAAGGFDTEVVEVEDSEA